VQESAGTVGAGVGVGAVAGFGPDVLGARVGADVCPADVVVAFFFAFVVAFVVVVVDDVLVLGVASVIAAL
jgi:hypothetical protein